MKKILITGANGVIGTVLSRQLNDYMVTPVDLPQYDLRGYSAIKAIIPGHDVVIHLAWNTSTDNAGSGIIDPGNTQIFSNVYRAALETGVPRIIVASSVHAHTLMTGLGQPPLSPYCPTVPNNPYGAHKIFMEALGKYYSTQGLEVIAIRFGGITPDDTPINDEKERPLRLSHHDLVTLMRTCIEKPMQEKFTLLWGMSLGASTFYELTNPFDWIPKENT